MKPVELLYPCFFQCCEFTENGDCKDILRNLAYGIPPTKSYIKTESDKTFISFKKQRFEIPTTTIIDPCSFYEKLMDFFGNEDKPIAKKTVNSEWKNIKKKKKIILIEQYVVKTSVKYKFNTKTKFNLLTVLKNSFEFKTIEIEMCKEMSEIQTIDGLILKKYSFTYEKNIFGESKSQSSGPSKINISRRMDDKWIDYIDKLTK